MSVDTTDPMTELHREIERLTAERDTANRERDDALNRLAPVRGMLTNLMARNDEYLQVLDQRAKALDAALARADKAERSAAELREALEPFGCETCKGTHLYTFECLGCLTGEGPCTCKHDPPQPCPQCQMCPPDQKALYEQREKALSSDAGKGYVRVEKLEPILASLHALKSHLWTFGVRPSLIELEILRLDTIIKEAGK